MAPHRILIPGPIIDKYGLDPCAPPHQFWLDHWFTEDTAGGLLILSAVYDFTASPYRRAYFSTQINPDGQTTQHNLPLLKTAIDGRERLSPMCVQGLGGRDWIVGSASSTITDDDRCGFFIGRCDDTIPPRFLQNCGSRIRIRSPEHVYGTLHNNGESRHPTRFDDAVCRYERFNPTATSVSQLGTVRLTAHLDKHARIDFEGLLKPPTRFELTGTETIVGVNTDYVEPLPDGRALVSMWNTALNVLNDYYFAIMQQDGHVDVRIRDIERRARGAFTDQLNQIVTIGETTSQLFDLAGTKTAEVTHPPRSKSLFHRHRLQGIWKSVGAVFAVFPSSRDEQTNTVLIVPEPRGLAGTEYLSHIHRAVIDYDRWLRAENKQREPIHYRWRE